MGITNEAIVTISLNTTAFIILLVLLLCSKSVRSDRAGNKLYRLMCIHVLLDAVLSSISYAMVGQTAEWCRPVAILAKTLMEVVLLNLVYQWLLYVDYILYESREHLRRRYRAFFVPIVLFVLLLMINSFTGIMFTFGEDLNYTATVFYYLMEVMEAIYFLITLLMVFQYSRQRGKMPFFQPLSLMLPPVLSILISEATPYTFLPLGLSIGLIFLYFSRKKEWAYEDHAFGCYNLNYLDRLARLSEDGKRNFRGRMVFETKGDEKVLAGILQDELPKGGDLIHAGTGRFLFFSEAVSGDLLRLTEELVREAAEDYAQEHAGAQVDLSVQSAMRRKDEKPADFIRGANA